MNTSYGVTTPRRSGGGVTAHLSTCQSDRHRIVMLSP
jgi:hypothetical protein